MVTDGKDESLAMAAQIRAERAAAEMTIDQLAAASGMHKQTLMRYLKGTRDIPLAAFYAIADGLGVAPGDLLARAQARHSKN
ncbi:helix-turn-helix domain-containing protein [Microbacterium karelineae]|uniref:helix-turn-helix domain-containing protein n=1 Tax=Microbacterium karelineae TaxID=2654283 RepID=UPI0012EAEB2C|nr:helix-turn-helix transcriptional regulator [Microbacterium karelineae]